MPITRRQFELGIDDAMARCMETIHHYLAERRDEAFTADEIFEGLRTELLEAVHSGLQSEFLRLEVPPSLVGHMARGTVNIALEKLCELGAVASRQIGGRKYYAYERELPPLR
jgi:hypothetical protein